MAKAKVVRYTERKARKTIKKIEKKYPKLREAAESSPCSCCEVNEVAHIYGWGDATNAYREWDMMRFLLGDR